MPGSAEVNRNLTLVMAKKLKLAQAAMDVHIKNSEAFARNNGPWADKTGITRETIGSKTQAHATGIKSSIFHSKQGAGFYLEKRRDFHGAYRILQEARSNNLAMLWAALRRIFQ